MNHQSSFLNISIILVCLCLFGLSNVANSQEPAVRLTPVSEQQPTENALKLRLQIFKAGVQLFDDRTLTKENTMRNQINPAGSGHVIHDDEKIWNEIAKKLNIPVSDVYSNHCEIFRNIKDKFAYDKLVDKILAYESEPTEYNLLARRMKKQHVYEEVERTFQLAQFSKCSNNLENYGATKKQDLRLFIGADHKGFQLKQSLISHLQNKLQIDDLGTDTKETTDYPDYAQKVAQEVQRTPSSFGVLICKTGTGMAITANRFKGIRAIIAHNAEEAVFARKHYDANILVLSNDKNTIQNALELVEKFRSTKFEPGKNDKTLKRIQKIDSLPL